MTYICENAFANCTNVSVTIPDTVELNKIGKDAFFNSKDYNTSTNWSKGVLILGKYLVAADKYAVSTSYSLGNTISLIADAAFSECSNLAHFTGGAALKHIGSFAFKGTKIKTTDDLSLSNCDNIKSVGENILSSVETDSTENRDTTKCGKLLLSVSPNERGTYVVDSDITCIAEGAFKNCKEITDVELPSGVTVIDDNTFEGCINLKSINIHDNITSIGKMAFKDCCSLTSVTIPSSVTTIGTLAFNGCRSVTNYSVTDGNAFFSADNSGVLYNKDKKVLIQYPCAREFADNYSISNSVRICDLAFQWCNNIKTVSIGDNVEFGNRNPFANCSAEYEIGGKGTSILYADEGTTLVSVSQGYNGSLKLPATVTKIGDYAVKDCPGITEVIIPCFVTEIGESAFENCTSLKSVTFEANKGSKNNTKLKTIGEYAFCNCPCNADGGCCNKDILKAEGLKIGEYSFHNHTEEYNTWVVTLSPTYDSIGQKVKHCSECARELVEYIPELEKQNISESIQFNGNGLVYGFNMNDKTVTEKIKCNTNKIVTGSIITITSNNEEYSYTAVIFGDSNCDGIYDGQDAMLVNCIVNGMLTREQVGEAVWTAADCNHDGVIDENDVALLNEAGLLLSQVDQTKSEEELNVDSVYQEYLSLIDQNPTDKEAEKPAKETKTFADLFKLIFETIFNYFKSLFGIK